jgi:hypothetical protein
MRARPCRADSALIVVRCRVSAHTLHLIPNDLQQVAKAFLRDRGLAPKDGYMNGIGRASYLGNLYSVAASLDSGQRANGPTGYFVRSHLPLRAAWPSRMQ